MQRAEERIDEMVCHFHPILYKKYQTLSYSKVLRHLTVLIAQSHSNRYNMAEECHYYPKEKAQI